nr:MAG TPA: hypothetical protein [Caudoviricetes sp.]
MSFYFVAFLRLRVIVWILKGVLQCEYWKQNKEKKNAAEDVS